MTRTVRVAPLALVLAGCSSVGSTAVRTGPLREPPYKGPVAVYAAGLQPAGADLGVVEVHGSNDEAAIDELVPVLVRRVAQLGGDAAVIDDVRGHAQFFTTMMSQTYTYPCGFRAICTGTRVYPVSDEVLTVVIRARAMKASKAPPPPEGK